jgi:endonuclease/exonuclease/phosphatase family metal-dependent hydrolase
LNHLKLATYNIRMETPDDANDLWKNRKENIINIIQSYDFDIIGFQEVKESQLSDLTSLSHYAYFGRGRSNDESNEYNPIFYKKEKFDVVKSDSFWLSETLKFGEKDKRWNADCPRICTWGQFRIKASGKEFYVFNTHFDHISEEARYHSALLLSHEISSIDSETPIFLTGDFNGDMNERFYHVLATELRDVVQESPHHVGPKGTCTGVGFNHKLKWDKYHCIDYIFANTYSSINKTVIITDQFHGRYPSDHFAVCLDSTLR